MDAFFGGRLHDIVRREWSVRSPVHGSVAEVRAHLGIFRDYPSTGVGLGAHEVVFPAYESQLNETVAEHVENEQLFRLLKELGCSAGQGFWLQRPAPSEQIHDLVQLGTKVMNVTGQAPRRRAA